MLSFKDIGGSRPWPFYGHMKSLLMWPLDVQYCIYYRWSVWTDRLSCTFVEILNFKDIESPPWPFGVTCHRSRDHWTHKVWFPIGSQYELTMYLARLLRYWVSKILGSRPWPFRVTWRHQSRDKWTWCAVSYRWSFEAIAVSRNVVEILCVNYLGLVSRSFG